MRTLLLLVLPALVLAACQTSRLPPGIYETAAAFRQRQPSVAGRQAGTNSFRSLVFAVRVAGRPGRVWESAPSVWGYVTAAGRPFRLFQHRAYLLKQADTLSIYGFGKGLFFSAGLNGPVRRLSRHQLRQEFANNTAFLAALTQLGWYRSLAKATPVFGNPRAYRIVELYKQSLIPANPAR